MKITGLLPGLTYEDAGMMVDWLTKHFGFEERSRWVDVDGVVRQVEMYAGDFELWFGGRGIGHWEREGYKPMQWVGVWVDDVDAFYERVKATCIDVGEPKEEDYSVYGFMVTDPEGVMWGFSKRIDKPYFQRLEDGWREILAKPN